MVPHTLLLALALLAPQERPPDEPPKETRQGANGFIPKTDTELRLAARYGDHYIAVVGEELITRDEVFAFIQSPDFEAPPPEALEGLSPEQAERERLNAALEQMIEVELQVQGGRTQGYEPEIIDQVTQRLFDRNMRTFGGPTPFSAQLEQWGFTPESFRSYLRERILARFWRESVTGLSVGATGRPYVDRYVRPGRLYDRYRAFARAENLELAAIVGKEPARVVLRRLVLDSSEYATPEAAEELARSLRQNILEDVVEFDVAVNQYAPTNLRGDEQFLRAPLEDLRSYLAGFHPDTDLEAFVTEAEVGTLSPVVRASFEGRPVFFVYRLDERLAPQAATPFVDLELQTRLEEAIQEEEDEVRIARGLAELVRSTYVDPPEIRNVLLRRGLRPREER